MPKVKNNKRAGPVSETDISLPEKEPETNYRQSDNMMSNREKCELYKALKERGTFDMDFLANRVKTKSKEQIWFHIMSRNKSVRHNCINNSVTYQNLEKQPLNKWFKAVPAGKINCSLSISQALASIAKCESHRKPRNDNEPDFQKIYEYLSICTGYGVPPVLSPVNSYVVMLLLRRLSEYLKERKDLSDYLPQFIKKLETVSKSGERDAVSENSNIQPDEENETNESNDSVDLVHMNGTGGENSSVSRSDNVTMTPLEVVSHEFVNPFQVPSTYLKRKTH
ncbi:Uncharacterised protein g4002 [Pycnogonum litorale]